MRHGAAASALAHDAPHEGGRWRPTGGRARLQVWPHRLASGFPDDAVRVAGKTGTLRGIRNEVGVVEFADGGRCAAAVFTQTDSPASTLPAVDAAIGTVARIAVDALRR